MSMYHLQKTFEKTLRTPLSNGTSVKSSPRNEYTPLKPEIHKGCTGKAHACGTIKNRFTKPQITPSDNNHRKNSLSSETISDSSSEVSNLESWNDKNIILPPIDDSKINNNKKNKLRNNSLTNGLISSPAVPKISVLTNGHKIRRRTIGNPIPVDEIDKSISNSISNKSCHDRLHSDGEIDDINDDKKSFVSTYGANSRRSFRLGSNHNSGKLQNNRPPWQSTYSKNNNSISSISPASTQITRNNSLRSSIRSSIRKKKDLDWNQIWEKSLTLRSGGGFYKNFDSILSEKVCILYNKQKVHLNIQFLFIL